MLAGMNGPGFQLGHATATEKLARDRLTFEAWGSRLSAAQYLDRERILRATEHGRLNMHSWVLRLPNGVVVASCETFRLPLMPQGAIEVIASVFVDRALRGARMASRLMEALIENRREAGIDALILFSEVGAKLYEHAGFKRLPAPTRLADARPMRSGGPKPLARDRLPELLALRNRFRDGRIDLLLNEAIVDWHLERARFYAGLLGTPALEHVGAHTDDAVVIWCPDYKNERLRLLEASGNPGAQLEPLLDAAAAQAHRMGLRAVELWDDAHSRPLGGLVSGERDDDLPMGLSFTPRGELFLGPLSRATWA